MLDFVKVLPRIREMVAERALIGPQLLESASVACESLTRLGADEWPLISERIRALPVSHLMATFLEPPDLSRSAPARPDRHTVLAVDGSQIPADRHEIAFCYVINVGTAFFPYGSDERVRLESHPSLYFRDEEVLEEFDGETKPVTPRRIASRRLQAECQAMTALLEEAADRGEPAVALIDGTLILWSLEAESPPVRHEVLQDFECLLNRARDLRIPVAGYISRPGSSDVVNALRAWECGLEEAACRLQCSAGRAAAIDAPCAGLTRISDHALFNSVRKESRRSALFGSQSKILRQMDAPNRVAFFYLNTGPEIARVEIPLWVADDESLTDLVHSVILDQVKKGLGYPRALTEAHEQAVVRAAERTAFFQLVQREMALKRVPAVTTRKAVSKRSRSV